jgi:hypothetical protein
MACGHTQVCEQSCVLPKVSKLAWSISPGQRDTHAIVLPSTVTLICHIARSPSPDMASDPICTGVVQECKEMLNGFPSGIPGTKQVSNGVGLVTAIAC